MKRFASHYLYVPDTGFLKQHVIEVKEEYVVNFFPLTEEIESVEWMPGVIELVPRKRKISCLSSIPFQFPNDAACRRNSAQTIAVAIATLSDSEVSRSCG